MKYTVAVLFCIVAAVSASGYGAGYDKAENFARERKVNYVNGQLQARVNKIAEAYGASSGTYQRDGVPGTKVYGYGQSAGYSDANRGYNAYPAGYNGAYSGYNAYPAGYASANNAYPGSYRAGNNNAYPAGYRNAY